MSLTTDNIIKAKGRKRQVIPTQVVLVIREAFYYTPFDRIQQSYLFISCPYNFDLRI